MGITQNGQVLKQRWLGSSMPSHGKMDHSHASLIERG